jgi:hypothetical protein
MHIHTHEQVTGQRKTRIVNARRVHVTHAGEHALLVVPFTLTHAYAVGRALFPTPRVRFRVTPLRSALLYSPRSLLRACQPGLRRPQERCVVSGPVTVPCSLVATIQILLHACDARIHNKCAARGLMSCLLSWCLLCSCQTVLNQHSCRHQVHVSNCLLACAARRSHADAKYKRSTRASGPQASSSHLTGTEQQAFRRVARNQSTSVAPHACS